MARVWQCLNDAGAADLPDRADSRGEPNLLEAADPVTLDTTYNVVKAKKAKNPWCASSPKMRKATLWEYGIYPDASQQCKSG